MKSLVIGKGQIGEALYKAISPYHQTEIRDIESFIMDGVEVLHICFPNSTNFKDYVKDYQDIYRPTLTIVHSSISVGDTKKLGAGVVYSPVRGRHPNLDKEIKIFTKMVSGYNPEDVRLAKDYFDKCEFKVETSNSPHTLELSKLLSNIHMGLECAWAQEVKRIIDYFEGDYETYLDWEKTYTLGYKEAGDDHLIRPIMSPEPIGGHCILDCVNILKKQFASQVTEFILSSNSKSVVERNNE